MSVTMALHTDQGRLFFKRYMPSLNLNPYTETSRITFAHAVQDYLWKRGFPVPRLLRNRDSDTLTVEGSHIYAISEFVDGYDYNTLKPTAMLQSAGEMLGRIHGEFAGISTVSCARVDANGRGGYRVAAPAAWADTDCRFWKRAATPYRKVRSMDGWRKWSDWRHDHPLAVREIGLFTATNRAQNLKFDDEGRVKSIFDLDTARPANRVFDLAYALVFFPAVYPKRPLDIPPEVNFFGFLRSGLSAVGCRAGVAAGSSQACLSARHDVVAAPPRQSRNARTCTSMDRGLSEQ